ncbi:inhibitor of nuclear factor kappa-B kinase subunit beta-like [Varroa jacobsoni]|uniref:inhibitor of nuclear factor kappa-B kinase subunit beta-like n=1 Tax=Varroa jacobsoni TaxID=62625 RepID=UPI000BF29CE2|nr:inhibitor of nuclear factor kappa-B kinase subunit beta-like [Varroa jacobsoni]
MDKPAEPVEVGGWIRREVFANGSFGQLSVWEEPATKKVIAVKIYKGSPQTLREKQRDYWIKEVEIMYKLNHPNVVRAVPLPEPLKNFIQSCVPPLALEFCRGGDLRRMLTRSENLCGLPEKEVRNVLRDICQGLIYLHKEGIIHRDLKPENIVIRLNGDNQRIYKIIDLGYAKELDQTSLAQSFVGTLAYLAPELFEQRPYRKTADYWSLGVLAFEVATGIRPFFHEDAPMSNLPHIKNKKNTHIYARKTVGGLEFYSTMPEWCRLNEVFKNDLTVWLTKMLAYDPKDRTHEPGSPSSLEVMLAMLKRPLAHVLHTNGQKVVSFTSDSVAENLYTSTMVPVDSQFLLSVEGQEIAFGDLLKLGASHLEDGSLCSYLFNFDGSYNLSPSTLPLNVKYMLAHYQKAMHYPEQRLLWQHMYNYVDKEFVRCCQMLAAYRALLVHINSIQSEFSAKLNGLSATYKEIKVLAQLLQDDQEYDEKELQKVQHSALEELRMTPGNDTKKVVTRIKDKMRVIVAKANMAYKQVLVLRENPFGRTKPPAALANLHDSVLVLLGNLRKMNNVERTKPHSNNAMVEQVNKFSEEHRRVLKEIAGHIVGALEHVKDVRQNLREANEFIMEVEKEHAKLKLNHQARRTTIWNVIKKLMISAENPSAFNGSTANRTVGGIDSITMMPDVDMLVRENEKYRSALDSLNAMMESEMQVLDKNGQGDQANENDESGQVV